ncbi:MAG: hypothetical protein KDD36_05305 [Flavobacteriales bacterium]|nr:hypothetical protein [Flavobacteriales bacterium]
MMSFSTLVFTLSALLSQDTLSLTAEQQVTQIRGEHIFADHMGSVYVVHGEEVKRFRMNAPDQVATFSQKNSGTPSFLDVTNPLKPLLFYPDFMQVQLLDRQLAAMGPPIALDQAGYPLTQLICTSHNNGYWIYDPEKQAIVRLDNDWKPTGQSGSLLQLMEKAPKPYWIQQANNKVYLGDHNNGILVFDIYGTWLHTLPILAPDRFKVVGDELHYVVNGMWHIHDMIRNTEVKYALPHEEISDFTIAGDRLYILGPKGIFSFRAQLPKK